MEVFVGRLLGDSWETLGTLETLRSLLGKSWETGKRLLGDSWETLGRLLGDSWAVPESFRA